MRVRGSEMPLSLQQEAKRLFVHRFTGEHKPQWASKPFRNGNEQLGLQAYPVQFKDDQDWLEHTYFELTKDGQRFSDRTRYCESYPTWPNNPKLRQRSNWSDSELRKGV